MMIMIMIFGIAPEMDGRTVTRDCYYSLVSEKANVPPTTTTKIASVRGGEQTTTTGGTERIKNTAQVISAFCQLVGGFVCMLFISNKQRNIATASARYCTSFHFIYYWSL